MKLLKDYLHLYLGCLVQRDSAINNKEKVTQLLTTSVLMQVEISGNVYNVKPILRNLSDMTEEECQKADAIAGDGAFDADEDLKEYYTRKAVFFEPKEFKYLLSIGIDLFGLIEAGLALDRQNFRH